MVRLTPQQRALVIKTYYETGSSIVETQKKLSSYFGVHYVNKANQILHALYTLREFSKPGRLRTRRARQNLFTVRENNNENVGVYTTRKNLTRILFHPYPTKLQKPEDNGKESVSSSSSGENGASVNDIDPVRQRLLVDEVGDAVNSSSLEITDTSNAIQETYKEPMDCPPHKKSNFTEYLNNSDNRESEVDSSVCNEHLENNIKDYCTLLRTLPTSLTPVENNIRDNKTLL
ncbi:hypothetical protein Anas_10976 [Armadillidium nasatum]|uniref:Uncharacterized protein n=1 Tax=Armadillidium nasatum TaxID=96803 RepID=A0A5N5SMK7_9CRUS|nr:hypothetical protein Anas_10976 [Armadillidium nasatum]